MSFEGVPPHLPDTNEWCRRIALVLNRTLQGKMNVTKSVTLTANDTSTVVELAEGQLGKDTAILFDPMTANAATELAAGSMYVATAGRDVMNNQFTITHANDSSTDRTFLIVLIG